MVARCLYVEHERLAAPAINTSLVSAHAAQDIRVHRVKDGACRLGQGVFVTATCSCYICHIIHLHTSAHVQAQSHRLALPSSGEISGSNRKLNNLLASTALNPHKPLCYARVKRSRRASPTHNRLELLELECMGRCPEQRADKARCRGSWGIRVQWQRAWCG
jgi:hypothetical protein